MTPSPEHKTGVTLAWVALGATIVAFAFSVRPVRASSLIFWVAVLAGGAIACFGGISHFRNLTPRRDLVASECRRLYEALKTLLEEQAQRQPRQRRFNGSRHNAWAVKTVERYEDDLQGWARKVFKKAVEAEALSEASRPLLDAKTPSQLANLRDLFRSAAEELEQRS